MSAEAAANYKISFNQRQLIVQGQDPEDRFVLTLNEQTDVPNPQQLYNFLVALERGNPGEVDFGTGDTLIWRPGSLALGTRGATGYIKHLPQDRDNLLTVYNWLLQYIQYYQGQGRRFTVPPPGQEIIPRQTPQSTQQAAPQQSVQQITTGMQQMQVAPQQTQQRTLQQTQAAPQQTPAQAVRAASPRAVSFAQPAAQPVPLSPRSRPAQQTQQANPNQELLNAVRSNNVAAVQAAAARGANNGLEALQLAAELGNLEVVQALFQLGLRINSAQREQLVGVLVNTQSAANATQNYAVSDRIQAVIDYLFSLNL